MLESALLEDSGQYECVGTSQAGEDTAAMTLSVYGELIASKFVFLYLKFILELRVFIYAAGFKFVVSPALICLRRQWLKEDSL